GLWSVVDLDGDGKVDLVVTDGATEQKRRWKIYKNIGTGFSPTSVDWSLPAGSPNGNGYFTFVNGLWSTFDLTGSGKIDLVVTEAATEKNRKWKRYENTGAGFAAKSTDWSLPAGSPNGNGYFIPANGLWSTFDLSGSGRPDLIVTEAATEKNRKWKRYENTGTGFADKAVDWALPAGSPNGNGFFIPANGLWSTVDLDGDKRPELVITDGATEQKRRWKIYHNLP
ncbi:MAG: VCBS repeat-containing protein, partial [Minicystis sp.]